MMPRIYSILIPIAWWVLGLAGALPPVAANPGECHRHRPFGAIAPLLTHRLPTDNNILTGSLPSSEVAALQAIYTDARGEQWHWTGIPWNFTQPDPNPCTENWQGIHCELVCSGALCAEDIVAIELVQLNMAGTLSSAIGDFPFLLNLTIINNVELTGFIPEAVGRLSSLMRLDLSFNLFLGSIPAALGQLTNLTVLNLANNYDINGEMPLELFDLPVLEELLLSNTGIEGTIPSEIGNLKQLQKLDLNTARLTGSIPPSIGNLTNLVTLALY